MKEGKSKKTPEKNVALYKRARKRRGVAQVEYAFLLGVFVVPMVFAFVAGGIDMFHGWEERRSQLLRPIP